MGKRIRRRFKKVIKTVTKIIFCRGCSTQVIPIDDNQTDTNPKHSKMKEKLKQKVMSRSAKNRAERPINETSTPITVVAATNYSTSTRTSIGPVDSETTTAVATTSHSTSAGTSIGPVDSETTTAVATTSHSTSAGTSIGPADSETPTPTTIIIAAIATTSHFTSARTSIGPAHGETSTTVAATVSSARTTGPDRCSPDASTHTNTVDQEYLQVRPGCYLYFPFIAIFPAESQTNENTVMLSVASEPVVIPRIPSAELLEKLEKFIENQEVTSRPLPDHCEIVDASLPCDTEQDEPLKLSVSDMLCIQNDPDLADHMDRFQGGVIKREPLYIVIDTKLSSPTIFQFDHPLFREGCFASRVHRKKISLEYCLYGCGNEFTGFVRVSDSVSAKKLFVFYTLDEWKSCTDVSATLIRTNYKGEQMNRYAFDLPYFNPGCTDFALCLESEDGKSWWDNNYGKNYRVGLDYNY
ncbi:uncharacterized protein LOC135342069 isoform X1 [Halichondria panicea]|uniref:uncharacterized protein LOC135342069 isoform X1 n=1 Tax=Halichondria panicea TaxID=6063 RepID=UPI00312B7693